MLYPYVAERVPVEERRVSEARALRVVQMELVERDGAPGQISEREKVGLRECGREERQLRLRLSPLLVDGLDWEALALAAEPTAQRAQQQLQAGAHLVAARVARAPLQRRAIQLPDHIGPLHFRLLQWKPQKRN